MKHKLASTDLSAERDKSLSEWDRLIEAANQRIKELKRSIQTWKDLRDAGEPWPGTRDARKDAAAS